MNSPLKWMGGKSKLIPFIEKHIPPYKNYYEPFFGSGAVFFSQQPNNSTCSDIQAEPILIMNAIKDSPKEFYHFFVTYSERLWNEGEDYYYDLRGEYNKNKTTYDNVDRAARFMVLLRSGFNGLIRFNPKGEWNVPFGDRGNKDSKSQAIRLHHSFSVERILDYSNFFNTGNKQFLNQPFEKTIQMAGEGDFIYCDPPYLTTTQQYNEWTHVHEKRLAFELKEAAIRGAHFILSNVYLYKGVENKELLELYSEFSYELKNHNYIVGPGNDRKQTVEEIIIFN